MPSYNSPKKKSAEAPLVINSDEEAQIRIDVKRLAETAHVCRQLYDTSLGRKVVNGLGASTFNVILRALRESMVMGASRLLVDPPQTKIHRNMPLELLIRGGCDGSDKFIDRLECIKNKYADISKLRNKMFAHRDRGTHTKYVNQIRGQDCSDSDIAFTKHTDRFLLNAAADISKLVRDWYKEVRDVETATDNPKDVTELLEVLDAGQSLLAGSSNIFTGYATVAIHKKGVYTDIDGSMKVVDIDGKIFLKDMTCAQAKQLLQFIPSAFELVPAGGRGCPDIKTSTDSKGGIGLKKPTGEPLPPFKLKYTPHDQPGEVVELKVGSESNDNIVADLIRKTEKTNFMFEGRILRRLPSCME